MSRREGIGLLAGVTALALGGVAAGLKLERDLIGRRLRAQLADADEDFFGLRSDGPAVETLDGVRLHVEVDELDKSRSAPAVEHGEGPVGDTDEVTVIFVHGYALSLDCWHFQRKHYRGRHRMIFYDQRSHGRSSRSSASLCRIPQLANDLAQVLLEVAGDGPVILIGHSMGGMTIMELARQHPEWFGIDQGSGVDHGSGVDRDKANGPIDGVGPIIGVGLVCTSADDLVDPHPVRGLPGRVAARLAEPALAVLNRIPAAVEQTRQAGSDLAYLITRGMTFPSAVPPSYVQFLSEMLGQTPLEVVADFLPAFAGLDESAGLAVINTVPATVVGAKQDLVTPYRHTEIILEHLPNAEKLILEESGHMAMIEHHEKVNALLDRLIERAMRSLDHVS
ncbi:MAG TPA: alpha/beta hydrolase [Microlunatus sp.]